MTPVTPVPVRTSWVLVPAPKPAARLRLVCFPYAGAGAAVFWSWPRVLPPEVELCLVQMPGREARLGEPPLVHWEDVIDHMVEALAPWMDRGFVLFGHSLGAMLAFELARRLRRDGCPGPRHLVVSGRRAPHIPTPEPPIHNAPEEVVIDELRRYGGTPEEVLQSPEARQVFLPVLRADFRMNETYVYRAEAPLGVPISIYGGEQDQRVPASDLEPWREHTTGAFRRVMFPGGHLFLNEHRAALFSQLFSVLGTVEHGGLGP